MCIRDRYVCVCVCVFLISIHKGFTYFEIFRVIEYASSVTICEMFSYTMYLETPHVRHALFTFKNKYAGI